jgi:hypothetical protein
MDLADVVYNRRIIHRYPLQLVGGISDTWRIMLGSD